MERRDAIREIALSKLRSAEKRIAAQVTRGIRSPRVSAAGGLPSAGAVAAGPQTAAATASPDHPADRAAAPARAGTP
jgi:hypothetical protein